MALIKTFEKTVSGFSGKLFVQNAYCKVNQITGSKDELTITVLIQEAKDGVIADTKHFLFNPNLDGKNFIAQAYDHLKTLPEFAGANDC
jgi:hypothetical protein